MEQQIERILELVDVVYHKSSGESMSEIWGILYEAYCHTKDKRVKEALLKYFYYPQKEMLQENYEKNKLYFDISNKAYGYGLGKTESECLVLWADSDVIYYFKGDDIKQQDYTLRCATKENRKALYSNLCPEHLPSYSGAPYILVYEEDVFECYMQCSSFLDALRNCDAILVGRGIEEYLGQRNNILYDIVIGYDVERMLEKIEKGFEKVWDLALAEKRESFGGLYDSKTFYIIRVKPLTSSLGPLILWVMVQLKVVEEKGYIPVIDFSDFWNIFLESYEIGIVNSWEYYFEQPTQFSLSAVHHAKNVIIGSADPYHSNKELTALIEQPEFLEEYCRIFNKYIHVNKRLEKKIMAIYNKLFHPSWKVLGVVYRGTDYRNRPVINENRQPSMEELMRKATELMESWGCDHLFLSTEDKGAVEEFRQVFGDKMVCVEKERYDSSVAYTQTYRFEREFDAYLKGEEYLTEIYILSKCNCLLSGRCGILAVALPMNNGQYEEKYIYDLGVYTIQDYL